MALETEMKIPTPAGPTRSYPSSHPWTDLVEKGVSGLYQALAYLGLSLQLIKHTWAISCSYEY